MRQIPRLPSVSIIIPALNEAARIGRALTAAQATGADEIVVADGGSTDPTVEIARELGATVINSLPGRAVQQNAGAFQASGDVLLFQHADNWLGRDAVNQIRQQPLGRNGRLGAFRQCIAAAGLRFRLLETGNAWRAAVRGLPYGDQGIFVDRHLFFDLGGFAKVQLMEDVIFMQRARQRCRPVLLPGPIFVDARRWRTYGTVHQTLRNLSLVLAYHAGVSPNLLARLYPRHDTVADLRGRGPAVDPGAVRSTDTAAEARHEGITNSPFDIARTADPNRV